MALYRCPSCGQVNYRYICDYCGVDCEPYMENAYEKEAHVKTEDSGTVYSAEEPKKTENSESVYSAEKPKKTENSGSVCSVEKPELTEHWRKIGISSEKGRLPWEFKTAVIIMLCFIVIVIVCSLFEHCSQAEETISSAYEYHEEASKEVSNGESSK